MTISKDPLRWKDGRRFTRKVEVHCADSRPRGTFLFSMPGEQARTYAQNRIVKPAGDCRGPQIWKVVLLLTPPQHLRVRDARPLTPSSFGTRYVSRSRFRVMITDPKVPVPQVFKNGLVYHFTNSRTAEQDLWAYRMAQLDAMGFRYPYPHLDSV